MRLKLNFNVLVIHYTMTQYLVLYCIVIAMSFIKSQYWVYSKNTTYEAEQTSKFILQYKYKMK